MRRLFERRRMRALVDKICRGGRVTPRDALLVGAVPRFALEARRERRDGKEQLAVRLRLPGAHGWSAWLTPLSAAQRLQQAGFIEAATDTLSEGGGV